MIHLIYLILLYLMLFYCSGISPQVSDYKFQMTYEESKIGRDAIEGVLMDI